ncbi:FAD-dependent monooxygenase [Amycolatopsis rhabdoformis]|uniref:FAD-dependent monooxygenase n=1 Tax=Amycolatopsis rhabdoformis TaxID=1448059 RepID=A0ABZ1HXL9_9PSEU|nr:FAD-dependent monooxygenase [Amycolatopsis rhabdoformis]WSE26878.1 FAD-dependent monooxygenase [Amycolatopsis rhabdoformis]
MRKRAVVAGGGVVGLTTGLALRRAGFETLVCEQESEIRGVGAALGLWANALAVFDRLGVGGEIRAAGAPSAIRYQDPAGEVMDEYYGDLADVDYLMITRQRLNELLAAALTPDELRTGARVTGYRDHDAGVTVEFSDGSTEEADLLVGADGVHSRIREQLSPGSAAQDYPGHLAWRGIVAESAIPAITSERFVIGRERTRGGVVRSGGGTAFWVIAQLGSPPPEGSPKEQALARVAHLYDGGWSFPLREAIEATPDERVVSNRVLALPRQSRWVSAHVALAGDSAHAVSPHITSGASLGVEDALVLAEHLTDADVPAALQAYEADRLPRYAEVYRWVDEVAAAADEPHLYAKEFFDFVRWMLGR